MNKEGKMFSVWIFRCNLGTNSCLSQLVELTPDINEHESCCWVNMNLLKSSHGLEFACSCICLSVGRFVSTEKENAL